jgi:hypothetical protein
MTSNAKGNEKREAKIASLFVSTPAARSMNADLDLSRLRFLSLRDPHFQDTVFVTRLDAVLFDPLGQSEGAPEFRGCSLDVPVFNSIG